MQLNQWTAGLAAIGVVSFASAARADQQMSQVLTAVPQTTLSGYVDTAMQWNPNSNQGINAAFPGNAPKYSFAQNDGFSLNAVDMVLDKPEDSSPWAAGYHAEMMYGEDSVGVPIGTANPSGFNATVRQAFVRLHTPLFGNGIDWEVGVFDSIIGYESNSGPLNPNYTRSYGYSIEPTTFTGVLGTYKVNDSIALSAGVANDAFVNSFTAANTFESDKCYMGSVALTAPDSMGFLKGATLSGGVVHNQNSHSYFNGFFGTTGVRDPGETTSLYVGATLPTPITQLKVGAAFDYLMEDSANFDLIFPIGITTPTTGADIWVVGGYATYQATDKLSLNLRGEYLDDKDAYNGFSGGFPVFSDSVSDVAIYPVNNAEEVTATVQYNLWANVLARGEFRWDHVEHGTPFGYNSAGNSFRSNDFLFALNLVYQF